MTTHVRAKEWVDNLDVLKSTLECEIQDLSMKEYAMTLRSFFRQLLKKPEIQVRPIYDVQIPVGDNFNMTISELILETSRERLYHALDLIVKHNGDINAAVASGEAY